VAGKRVAASINGVFDYFGYDALGSQVLVLNNSGNVVGSQLYGPYGNQRYSFGTLPTSIGFTGQQADSVTGLDYYNARYYDPVAGQFLSADNVQGNAQGVDPYSYVAGNPETMTDPTGQKITCGPESCGGPPPPPTGSGSDCGSGTHWNGSSVLLIRLMVVIVGVALIGMEASVYLNLITPKRRMMQGRTICFHHSFFR
jgi:RHS repeat-associated protein